MIALNLELRISMAKKVVFELSDSGLAHDYLSMIRNKRVIAINLS